MKMFFLALTFLLGALPTFSHAAPGPLEPYMERMQVIQRRMNANIDRIHLTGQRAQALLDVRNWIANAQEARRIGPGGSLQRQRGFRALFDRLIGKLQVLRSRVNALDSIGAQATLREINAIKNQGHRRFRGYLPPA